MKTLGIKIVNEASGKQVANGRTTHVFVVTENADGEIEEIEISNVVRAADVRLHVNEVVTARLECFVTGLESRATVENLIVRNLRPRRSIWRRLRDVTTFGSRAQEYA